MSETYVAPPPVSGNGKAAFLPFGDWDRLPQPGLPRRVRSHEARCAQLMRQIHYQLRPKTVGGDERARSRARLIARLIGEHDQLTTEILRAERL